MVTDQNTNFVYFSSLIKERPRLKCFWHSLEKTLAGAGINYSFIDNTRDLWCRDYMPLQTSKGRFVQFRFYPSYYDDDRWRHLLTDTNQIEVETVPATAITNSTILLDGGNVIRAADTVILTDRVLKENPTKTKPEVVLELKQVLQVNQVYLIPALPYEISGHADGMVRLLDDRTLLVADFQHESTSWNARYKKSLEATGLELIDFPNVYDNTKNEHGEYAALGCYINFAWIGEVILFPQFDLEEDKLALAEAKKIFNNNKVLPVPAADLAMSCGVLNCATWNIQL
jgi:agmatine deiminase